MKEPFKNGGSIPAQAGIGLRSPHIREILETLPDIGWLEVHSENYFAEGGPALTMLDRVRSNYPISLHGVGLSLGSTDPLDIRHLTKLKFLISRCDPCLVSEHLSWSSVAGRYANDLLPLPYTEEALQHVCRHVQQTQEFLGREILIENPASCLQFSRSTILEWEFLTEIAARTGCGILLDVNNIHVSAVNHHFDPNIYIQAIPLDAVQEIHLAGFEPVDDCLVDTHSRPVCDEVWNLYRQAVRRFGIKPTLIEWDADIPPLSVLLEEADKARRVMEEHHVIAA